MHPVPSRKWRTDEAFRLYCPAGLSPHKSHLLLLKAPRIFHDRGGAFELVISEGSTEKIFSDAIISNPELEMIRQFMIHSSDEFRNYVKALGFISPEEVID